ncbi:MULTISPECIES: class 1b ribonucleoside-diphosphate reductase subunit beta [Paraclostridium]|uniref:Ribonucleoside-diphosphate reductase subunit beta n=1 Tax=Paraclostridium bifermentans TaxID=1490 RepID=A0A5P3XEK1_PARBF|nr:MULTISPECIES: class 1b ribonucleoside-diphosphate reductase subunit beta [Paraclostridium]KGJ49769.1 ribonucleotide-diphosphate reductase [Clostridium sp. NCR]MDV8114405.1 class 1b ribonucleoside-diphosphate reductase subunit beta [Bacillus sp. BAU-SS-2023]MBZ6005724.1 class 1b ribonucleoside-diphosphate reductase subunit beta [Paraclostridium bifermentans]MCE9674950.1 class 1b ribonucleoside-diphosphate reductase subunit beta [Paraclostridium bifermentans]MDU0297119.1 class 1b ribonucleosi
MTFKANAIHKAVNWNVEDDGFTQAFWDQNVKQFWLPEEISVSKDLKTWADLSESEKELYKKVLAGLTLLDTKQGNNGVPSMMSLTDNLQRKAVLSFMGTMEEIHAKSYSSIFMTLLTTPQIEDLFNWIETEPTLQKKADLILAQYENTNDQRSLYLSMVTSVFLESFLFYSGFFYPLYLAGQGKMVASGEIISLILRDESLHGKYIGLLAQEIYDSFNDEDKLELKNNVYKIFKNLMDNEIEYTKKIYNESGLVEEVITFLQYNANRALENLGFDKYYEVGKINPIVLNGLSTETKSHDFFSTKGNGYQKGIYEELEDEDFII